MIQERLSEGFHYEFTIGLCVAFSGFLAAKLFAHLTTASKY